MSAADVDRKVNAVFGAIKVALAAISGLRSPRDRINAASQLSDRLRAYADEAAQMRNEDAIEIYEAEGMSLAGLASLIHVTKARAHQIVTAHRKAQKQTAEVAVPEVESPSKPEQQTIVAAVVTNGMAVLIGRRNDGKPPWTFIAGKIEPGESAEDAGVREVKEETGLEVRATGIIGRRIHPKTQTPMVYMSAEPVRDTHVFVGDTEELAEVRWVTLSEAVDLLPGLYDRVHEHLAREIGS